MTTSATGILARLQVARARLHAADPVIAGLIDRRPDYDPGHRLDGIPPMDLFGALVFQVTGQELSVASRRRILDRMATRDTALQSPTAAPNVLKFSLSPERGQNQLIGSPGLGPQCRAARLNNRPAMRRPWFLQTSSLASAVPYHSCVPAAVSPPGDTLGRSCCVRGSAGPVADVRSADTGGKQS
jgi:hypothetical protein